MRGRNAAFFRWDSIRLIPDRAWSSGIASGAGRRDSRRIGSDSDAVFGEGSVEAPPACPRCGRGINPAPFQTSWHWPHAEAFHDAQTIGFGTATCQIGFCGKGEGIRSTAAAFERSDTGGMPVRSGRRRSRNREKSPSGGNGNAGQCAENTCASRPLCGAGSVVSLPGILRCDSGIFPDQNRQQSLSRFFRSGHWSGLFVSHAPSDSRDRIRR